jgi:hypothetical protein
MKKLGIKFLAITGACSHIGPRTDHVISLLVLLARGLEFCTGYFAQVTTTAESGQPAMPRFSDLNQDFSIVRLADSKHDFLPTA